MTLIKQNVILLSSADSSDDIVTKGYVDGYLQSKSEEIISTNQLYTDGYVEDNGLVVNGQRVDSFVLDSSINTTITNRVATLLAGENSKVEKPIGSIIPKRSSTVTIFQTSHGFANNAGGSANLNDTTDFIFGSQAISCVTDGAGTAKTIKKTAFTNIDASGSLPVIALKINSQTNVAALQLWLGSSNLANYYRWEFKNTATQPWILDGEWAYLVLNWGDATTGGSPSRATITDAQFRIVDNATGTVTTHFNLIGFIPEQNLYSHGVVCFSFDDAYESQFTTAKPILDAYGFPATAYVIRDYIGTTNRLTLDQCKKMRDYSHWDISPHTTTGTVHANRFTSLTSSQLDEEFKDIKRWINENGFDPRTIAYPGGEFNATVIDRVERHFIGARTVYQKPETLPPSRASKIKVGAYLLNSTLTSTITAAIDLAYTNKQMLNIVAHNVITTPVESTDVSTANFQTIVDYVATKGISVRTIGDVLSTPMYSSY